jgi:hypothetical protein
MGDEADAMWDAEMCQQGAEDHCTHRKEAKMPGGGQLTLEQQAAIDAMGEPQTVDGTMQIIAWGKENEAFAKAWKAAALIRADQVVSTWKREPPLRRHGGPVKCGECWFVIDMPDGRCTIQDQEDGRGAFIMTYIPGTDAKKGSYDYKEGRALAEFIASAPKMFREIQTLKARIAELEGSGAA